MKPDKDQFTIPGPIVLFGSGETAPSGQKVFDSLFRKLPDSPGVHLIETPAGFELNSDQVIRRVADFLQHHLQNYDPKVKIIPARKRNTEYSPDDAEIVAPILESDLIFMGPGSPTYAVRQLKGSLAWNYTLARHFLGAALALASAATIAVSAYALPVYEIYKVGEELHWKEGLDLFSLYGMPVVFIPHWNNNDGGEDLDTSRCYMGKSRFSELMEMIPKDITVLGIDEHTALIMDLRSMECQVVGVGGVTLIHKNHRDIPTKVQVDLADSGLGDIATRREAHVHQYRSGDIFPLKEWFPIKIPDPGNVIPGDVWKRAQVIDSKIQKASQPPEEVLDLVEERQAARREKKWEYADQIRTRIAELGWQVNDTPQGPELSKNFTGSFLEKEE